MESVVLEALDRRERIPGVGRPVLRGDERVPPMLEAIRRNGRSDGVSVTLTLAVDQELARWKGLRLNSAGLCGAVMRDIGFSSDATAAFCLIYFLIPVLLDARVAVGSLDQRPTPGRTQRFLGNSIRPMERSPA